MVRAKAGVLVHAVVDTDADCSVIWFKDAVLYEAHVKAFDDGIGDFVGIKPCRGTYE